MARITHLLAGAALLVSAGAANAGDPTKLTDAQMDTVVSGFHLQVDRLVRINTGVDSPTGGTRIDIFF